MLALEVELLLGRCVATDTSDRERAEWPPHPTRLFSALVDALGDVRLDSEQDFNACESALRWLETLPAPEIAASYDKDVSLRTPRRHWVPINDEVVDKARSAPLTDQRKKQDRFFPAAVPMDPILVYAWPGAEAEHGHDHALARLAERVVYLGHSSSLVRVALRSNPPPRNLVPAAAGTERLRVPGPGRLDRLNAIYELRKSDTLVQPPRGREVAYRVAGSRVAEGPHGDLRVFAIEGISLGIEHTGPVLSRFRAALLSHLGDDAPEVLTGHGERNMPSTSPHLAFIPLAHLGSRYATGSLKGVGVVIPRSMGDDHVLELERALAHVRTLKLGALGTLTLRPTSRDSLASLDPRKLAQRSRRWLSATPVVLGNHPKPGKGLGEEEIVCRELAQLGLPPPMALRVQRGPFLRGSPRADSFSIDGVSAARSRLRRHVAIEFAVPVQGPLLIGAGRHFGLGLLLPSLSTRKP